MTNNEIIVVTGLPRSGTSLMMQILQSLNIELFTDKQRSADESNPKGYFEHEVVKTIEKDNSWLKDVRGRAIKIVSPLIKYLPLDLNYNIIFMNRALDEIIQSQQRMLAESNIKDDTINSTDLKQIFIKDLKQTIDWIDTKLKCEYLEIFHSKLFVNPESEIKKLIKFLEIDVDIKAAVKVIDQKLYRTKVN